MVQVLVFIFLLNLLGLGLAACYLLHNFISKN
jgi:hypothetical protein